MESLEYGDHYRITVSEMSRKSHLSISTWFNEWLMGSNFDKLQSVSAISTQVILHSRIMLYRDNEVCQAGVYDLGDGVTFAIPLTEASLDNLPLSLAAWIMDAAGKENALVLQNFLAGVRAIANRRLTTPA